MNQFSIENKYKELDITTLREKSNALIEGFTEDGMLSELTPYTYGNWKEEYLSMHGEDALTYTEEAFEGHEKAEDTMQDDPPTEPVRMIAKNLKPVSKRDPTVTLSIAVPGSILEKQKHDALAAFVASQIARAATIYEVDEIVVYNEHPQENPVKMEEFIGTANQGERSYHTQDPNVLLANLLFFLDTAPYLRKAVIPHIPDFGNAGVMSPVLAPHHGQSQAIGKFRQGVMSSDGEAYVGLKHKVRVVDADKHELKPDTPYMFKFVKDEHRVIVSSKEKAKEKGMYCGYKVRLVNGLHEVWSQCPYEEGYDATFGTSERGTPYEHVNTRLPPYRHALIVFGAPDTGLREAVMNDAEAFNFPPRSNPDPAQLFNFFLNVCPNQQSSTIRSEEAVFITLSQLSGYLDSNQAPSINKLPCFNPLKK